MIGRGGIFGALVLLALSAVFAAKNGARLVTVDLGVATVQRVPLPVVVFVAVLLGMIAMLAAGLHSDLKVRGILKQRLNDEDRREREWRDRNQQDLFQSEAPSTESDDASVIEEPSPSD